MKKFILFLYLFGFVTVSLFSQAKNYTGLLQDAATYIEKNQLDSATVTLKKAMRAEPANPKNNRLLWMLGNVQRKIGLFNDAYVCYSAALAHTSDSISLLLERADLLTDMNRFDEAMDDYQRVLDKNPHETQALYRQGLLYLHAKNRASAVANFQQIKQLDSESEFSLLSQALLCKLDDKWDEAADVYSKLMTKNNVSKNYTLNRAECYVNSNQLSKASADLHNTDASEKEQPLFYFLRGQIRLKQFDKLAAQHDFEKAKTLGYNSEIVDAWIKRCK